MTDGNEWVYVRVWLGPSAVAHDRAAPDVARRYIEVMRLHFDGLRYTIDPFPTINPPTRDLPAWQLELAAP